MSGSNSYVAELRDVKMQFEDKIVLDDLSLKILPMDRLVILGQSGSGKSTILRLILGLLRPDDGSVFFKQFEITRLPRRKLQRVRRHIGMVYQYSALLSSLTVRDNIALPLAFVLITFFHIIIGELAPKSIAIRNTEETSIAVAVPLRRGGFLARRT